MSLTPAAIRLLAEKGLSAFDIADVAEAMTPVRNANAERQARFRDKRKAAKEGGSVTDDNVTRNVTPPNDNISNPPQDIFPSPAKAGLAPRGKSKSKAARLPDNWEPEPLIAEVEAIVAAWPVGQIERELSKFKDYWKSASGRRAAKPDWQAAWRNWLRNADDWKPKNGHAVTNGRPADRGPDPILDALARATAEAAAAERASADPTGGFGTGYALPSQQAGRA